MDFTGFTQEDFDTFQIEGLPERMEAIRSRIQPKFQAIGGIITDELTMVTGDEMFLHIAKHARRKVNPPKDTWLAISENKRGYKQHPHFQVGLFDDHLFIWLAFIYELPNKQQIAENLLSHFHDVENMIPADFVISQDHTKKDCLLATEADLENILVRFRDIKKAEFLAGRHIPSNDPILQDGEKLLAYIKETFDTLVPLYKIARGEG